MAIFSFGCNTGYKLEKDQVRYLDIGYDSCAYKNFGIKRLKLILRADNSFYFEPKMPMLDGYEGEWYVEVFFDDLGNEVFKCKNGKKFETFAWYNVEINGVTCNFYFATDSVKDTAQPRLSPDK